MTRTGSWWVTEVRMHQSLTAASKQPDTVRFDTCNQHIITELLLCAKHWTPLLFFLFLSAYKILRPLRKILTCFQMTTRTISEMMTITNSTRTAAATVSSERRARGGRGARNNVWTCRRTGQWCGCVWTRNLPLLVDKHEGSLARFRDGQCCLSNIYTHETSPPLPLEERGTKFNQKNAIIFSKGAPMLTFWAEQESECKNR